MAYRFFKRTNGLYSKVREDVKTGTRAGGMPQTVEAAMDILRPFERPVMRSNHVRQRGVYVAQKKDASVPNGWSHRCPAHKTNEHAYNDNICKEIIRNSAGSSSEASKQGRVQKSVNDNRRGGRRN